MKLLLLTLAVFAVTNAHRHRRSEPNLRNQLSEVYENAKSDFPMDEFKGFWAKVAQQSGKTAEELKSKFEENKGDMDTTLAQAFEDAQDKYPIMSQQWNRIQAKWEDKKDDLLELQDDKLSDLYGKAKSFLESKYGTIDFEDFKDNISGYLAGVGMSQTHRRFKRAEPNLREHAKTVLEKAKADFPMEEFSAFWSKVQENSGRTQAELKAKFAENKGDMDLTLEQVVDKTKNDYPIITQQWNRVKSTWDAKKDDMLAVKGQKFSELYEQAKTYLEAQYGGPIDFERFKAHISGYLAGLGMPTHRVLRRYKRAEPNLREHAQTVLEKAKSDFPMEEFNAFWSKIQENSGKTQAELKAKFDENKGDMDLTLEQVVDKTKSDYPILTQQWNRIQSTWNAKKDDMLAVKGQKFSELYEQAKTYLEGKYGGSIDFDQFKSKISNYLAAIGAPTARRFKREANLREVYGTASEHFHENFPKEEFNAFISKLAEKAQMTKGEIQQKLEANKGNMDLTLEEVAGKVQDDYPVLSQQWGRIKSKWETTKDSMDETTLQDLFNKVKGRFQAHFGNVDFQDFYMNIKNYLASAYAGPARRRYRREVPAPIQHIKNKFESDFPKDEWDTFYPKFEEFMKSIGVDAQSKLAEHKGNMDLTLEEVKDQAMDKYPALQQQWERARAQMDECIGRMDETSVKDLFKVVKSHAESVLGGPIDETKLKGFVANLQSYFTTYLNRLTNQGY